MSRRERSLAVGARRQQEDGDRRGNAPRDRVGVGVASLTLLATTAPAPYDALVVPHASPDSTLLESRILSLHRRMRPPAMLLEVCRADRFVRSSVELYGSFSRGGADGSR